MWKPLIVDGHQDLAYNMASFGRDYTRPVSQTRRLEQATAVPEHNGDTLLGWPEYMQGRMAIIFATLFAAPQRRKLGEWDHQVYRDVETAHRLYYAQLDSYYRLVEDHPDKFHLLLSEDALVEHLDRWQQVPFNETPELPVGLILLMENAEAVRHPDELAAWWQRGVRLIGPAWAGTRFCGGTREPGPLTKEGYALLEGMAEYGFVLDISHMDETAALQALDTYPGRVIASHANALALLPGTDSNRHLTDRVIQGLLDRDGIVGIIPANGFLRPEWKASGGRESVSLAFAAAQIDYICQLAGDAHHAAIGSDYDGGFGLQSVPAEVDSIADLQKLVPHLGEMGYSEAAITAVMGGNWIQLMQECLP